MQEVVDSKIVPVELDEKGLKKGITEYWYRATVSVYSTTDMACASLEVTPFQVLSRVLTNAHCIT